MKKFHELKLLDKYYQDVVVKRIKQFEIRKNDRDFQVGDIVSFTNVDGKNRPHKSYFLITYVQRIFLNLDFIKIIASLESNGSMTQWREENE